MVENIFEFERRKLTFYTFMRIQALLIERCNEIDIVCTNLKQIADKYHGKRNQLKRFIAEVDGVLPSELHIEVVHSADRYKHMVGVTTRTFDRDLQDNRVNSEVLLTFYVHEFIEDDGVFNANNMRMVASTLGRNTEEVRQNAREDCRKYDEWDRVINDAVEEFYDKIKVLPEWFLKLEQGCVDGIRIA